MSLKGRILKNYRLSNLPDTDHRSIGIRQNLFLFAEESLGSCFFEPRGARIYNKLVEYLKTECNQRGYHEVITPNIFDCKLWERSGHWDHYKDNIIKFNLGDCEYGLKPMNCPGHCLMFKNQKLRGSHELPVRWADFGVLHRNELSGCLSGLARARKFQQDDAHIFCTPEQVGSEVSDCLNFANHIYKSFGFSFDLELSSRPKSYLGSTDLWDRAEQSLRVALDNIRLNWVEQKFEGAFYGPKIDMIVRDTRQRANQCATIQLDFQLPERFQLEYRDDETNELRRPVIIHRAILGSVERFIAMLAETHQGRWPFWLSPLQAKVIPVHEGLNDYAEFVCKEFRDLGLWFDHDVTDATFNAKIREAISMPYNLVIIVGDKERSEKTVTCRILSSHDNVDSRTEQEPDKKRRTVRNLRISLDKLKELCLEFEKSKVDRADTELLKLNPAG